VERSEYPNRHPRACWQEAVEREVCVPAIQVWEPFDSSFTQHFSFPALQREEPKREAEHDGSATILYRQETVSGVIEISGLRCLDGVSKITVRVRNQDPFEMTSVSNRDDALMKSLVSTHTILGLHEGEFVSLLDPPNALQELAASCRNVGTWPVLAGEPGGRDTMLSSPIILYDHPQVAPESTGDLFDATEIDEILSLRIMALTDEEKSEIRTSDSRARQILERTDNIPPEQLMKLHGVLRGLRPLKEDAHE
jgi:hydrogenase maturation protease